MVIPVGAPNPTAAYEWMNYVYEPENQAQIAAYNSYVTPVDGVQEIFEKQGSGRSPRASSSSPTRSTTENCSTQPDPPGDAEDVPRSSRSSSR